MEPDLHYNNESIVDGPGVPINTSSSTSTSTPCTTTNSHTVCAIAPSGTTSTTTTASTTTNNPISTTVSVGFFPPLINTCISRSSPSNSIILKNLFAMEEATNNPLHPNASSDLENDIKETAEILEVLEKEGCNSQVRETVAISIHHMDLTAIDLPSLFQWISRNLVDLASILPNHDLEECHNAFFHVLSAEQSKVKAMAAICSAHQLGTIGRDHKDAVFIKYIMQALGGEDADPYDTPIPPSNSTSTSTSPSPSPPAATSTSLSPPLPSPPLPSPPLPTPPPTQRQPSTTKRNTIGVDWARNLLMARKVANAAEEEYQMHQMAMQQGSYNPIVSSSASSLPPNNIINLGISSSLYNNNTPSSTNVTTLVATNNSNPAAAAPNRRSKRANPYTSPAHHFLLDSNGNFIDGQHLSTPHYLHQDEYDEQHYLNLFQQPHSSFHSHNPHFQQGLYAGGNSSLSLSGASAGGGRRSTHRGSRRMLTGPVPTLEEMGLSIDDEEFRDLHIGESGRATLKSYISAKCRSDPEARLRVLAIGQVKYARLVDLLRMAKVCDLWEQVLSLHVRYMSRPRAARSSRSNANGGGSGGNVGATSVNSTSSNVGMGMGYHHHHHGGQGYSHGHYYGNGGNSSGGNTGTAGGNGGQYQGQHAGYMGQQQFHSGFGYGEGYGTGGNGGYSPQHGGSGYGGYQGGSGVGSGEGKSGQSPSSGSSSTSSGGGVGSVAAGGGNGTGTGSVGGGGNGVGNTNGGNGSGNGTTGTNGTGYYPHNAEYNPSLMHQEYTSNSHHHNTFHEYPPHNHSYAH